MSAPPPPSGNRHISSPGRSYLTEEEKAQAPKVTKQLLKRIFSYFKPYWKQFVLVVVCIVASSSLALVPQILTGRIIDDGLIGQNLQVLAILLGLSFGVIVVSNLIGVAQTYLNAWISQHITFDMRNKMFKHLQSMSQSFFTSNSQGDIITRMTSDISGVESVISNNFTSVLSNVVTLVVALVAMFTANPIMALIGLVLVPLFVIPTRRAGRKRWTLTSEAQQRNDQINGILNETLSVSGQTLVKLFNKEDAEYQRYEQVNGEMIKLNIKERMAGRWFHVALSIMTNVGPMLIYLAGGIIMMQYDPTLTVGDIAVLVSLLGSMYRPINALLNIQVEWVRSMAMFTRIFEYFDMEPEIKNSPDAVVLQHPQGHVEFCHVDFAYTPQRQILHDVSFDLQPGKSIALVGPSGSGKSTIVNLIPRLYDVSAGCVKLDGVDVRQLDLHFLRSQVGIVTQDTYLFNGTIRDNLLYVKPEATEQELVNVCQQANIYDFIQQQELGFDTQVGNRGLKLSGGEKQRISIARVLLKNPTLLVFDEATSALDSISERKIQDAIDSLLETHTSILIAHRLSTILAADEILVIKDGSVVERGQHEQLVKAGGVYTQLYETQFSEAAVARRAAAQAVIEDYETLLAQSFDVDVEQRATSASAAEGNGTQDAYERDLYLDKAPFHTATIDPGPRLRDGKRRKRPRRE